jgi:hypothetical protein
MNESKKDKSFLEIVIMPLVLAFGTVVASAAALIFQYSEHKVDRRISVSNMNNVNARAMEATSLRALEIVWPDLNSGSARSQKLALDVFKRYDATRAEFIEADLKPIPIPQPPPHASPSPLPHPRLALINVSGVLYRTVASAYCPAAPFVPLTLDGNLSLGLKGTTLTNNTAELLVRTKDREPQVVTVKVGTNLLPIQEGGTLVLTIANVQECSVNYVLGER